MNLKFVLSKLLYMPVCRAYARYIMGDKPADSFMRYLSAMDFRMVHGYWPRFRNPRSFNEKVCSRMLYVRNPLFVELSDKLLARDYVASKIGYEYLIPLLWHGEKPEDIPFNSLPLKFVIKTNHGCNYVIIVNDKTRFDRKKAILQLKKWLGENFCRDKALGTEWAYKNIQPIILIESFLEENGNVPMDYKFLCYLGRAEFVQVDFDRFGNHSRNFYDRDFNLLNLRYGHKRYLGKVPAPENYKEMILAAESLAKSFDFIRVDLYSVSGRAYFGELTCYPGGGRITIVPKEQDFLLGIKWK